MSTLSDKVNIENMILSTFLFLNDLAQDGEIERDLFKLDDSIFSTPFRKKIAMRINEVEDEAYSFLSYEIEESVMGTSFEMEWVSVLSQNSLPLKVVKKYHDDLVEKTRLSKICR